MKYVFAFVFILINQYSFAQDDTTVVVSPPFMQDWKYVTASNDMNKRFYIKSEYVNKENSEIRIWVKTLSKTDVIKKKTYKNVEEKQLWIIDCYGKQTKIIQMHIYDSKGNVILTAQRNEYLIEWSVVVPDTIGEAILEKVCKEFN